MTDNHKTQIETVIVELNGRTIDCLSFTSPDQADTYKRGVRSWASQRGVVVRVYSELMEVARKAPISHPANAPGLALAV